MDSPQLADVVFNVDGHKVCAHKVVLSARCDVMAAMCGGQFRDGTALHDEVRSLRNATVCAVAMFEVQIHVKNTTGVSIKIYVWFLDYDTGSYV